MLGLHKLYMSLTKVYIMALKLYLPAYHTYKAEALRVPEIQQLNTMSRNALENCRLRFSTASDARTGRFAPGFVPRNHTHGKTALDGSLGG